MSTIITRSVKGSPLTWDEMDDNLLNLKYGSYTSVKDSAYGAVGDGTTDDTSAIQLAVNRGGNIFFPIGTYKLSAGITVGSNTNIICERGVTFDTTSAVGVNVFYASGTFGTAYSLTANTAVGDTSLTVSGGDGANIVANDWVMVQSETVYDTGYAGCKIGEIIQVESSVAGTITFKVPLVGGPYTTAATAKIKKCNFVENVSVNGGYFIGPSTPTVYNCAVRFDLAFNSNIYGVRGKYLNGNGINLRDSIFCCVDKVHIEDSLDTGSGYGVNLTNCVQDTTVINSTFARCRHAVTNTGGASAYGLTRRVTYQNCKSYKTINTGDAFDTHSNAEDIVFDNCISYNSSSSGFNIECGSVNIIGCKSIRSVGDGITLTCGATIKPNEFTVDGCVIDYAGVYGIRVGPATTINTSATKFVKISDCTANNITNSGVFLNGNASMMLTNAEVSGGYYLGDNINAGGAYIGDYVKKFRINGGHYVATQTASNPIQVNGTSVSYGIINNNILEFSVGSATGACLYIRKCNNVIVSGNQGIQPTSSGYGVRVFESPTKIHVDKSNDFTDCNVPGVGSAGTITMASDTITLPITGDCFVTIDTEAAGATDNLSTINGGKLGQVITLSQANSARDPTIIDDTGNLRLAGNFVMTSVQDSITLIYNGSAWIEVGRADIA